MFGKDWSTSTREYEVRIERDVAVPVDEDIELVGDFFFPQGSGEFPTILSASPYNTGYQSAPMTPRSSSPQNAWIESGDPWFFARRGYVHGILNVRGTGKSDGRFRNLGPREITDILDAIEWVTTRPWSSGHVGMFGISYFGMIQPFVAERVPSGLDAIFAPWSATDLYRDWYYHGGIFSQAFTYKWSQQLDNLRPYSWSRNNLTDDEFERRIRTCLRDEEIQRHPVLVDALENPGSGVNPLLVDVTINRFHEPGGYFDERRLSYEETKIPGYFGADWRHHNAHLPAGFRNFEQWDGPSKLIVGPRAFVDRPFYQLHHEALRWFDQWLRGEETGVMQEPAVNLYLEGDGTWKTAEEWPVPETKWTEFFLHEDGTLSEHEHLPREGFTTFDDSPFRRESITFRSPKFVEETEVVGPIPLWLHAATTDDEILFFISVFREDASGERTELSKGWLRASQRMVDDSTSEPWHFHHTHNQRSPVDPDETCEYRINVLPIGAVFQPGERIGLGITCSDAEHTGGYEGIDHTKIESIASKGAHLSRPSASRVTIYHNAQHPSKVAFPITRGNKIGTYRSGGQSPEFSERIPYQTLWKDLRP